jgi:hypothetical protein
VRCGSPEDEEFKVLVTDPKMIWPDSMALGTNGYLYFTCNQINRQALFHRGTDMRQRPYHLYRVKVD